MSAVQIFSEAFGTYQSCWSAVEVGYRGTWCTQIARQLDEEEAGKVRGMLHGVPVLIKDNIDTFDKMQTTAGSLAFKEI